MTYAGTHEKRYRRMLWINEMKVTLKMNQTTELSCALTIILLRVSLPRTLLQGGMVM